MNDDAAERHARFLPYFAPHGFFHGLGRFDESSQCAEPVRGPAFLAAEQDACGGGGDDGHDDGGVGAWEGEVGDTFAGGAGRARDRRQGGGGRGRRRRRRRRKGSRHVRGGTGAFHAGVDGEGGVTALGAKGVTRVPIQQRAGLGEDGGFQGGQGHVHAAFDELEAPGLHFIDEGRGLGFDGAFRGDVQGEEGGAAVDVPQEAIFLALVQAKE